MDDVREILQLEHEFIAAWNRGDAGAAAALFAADGRRVGAFGDVSDGRDAVEAALGRLLGGGMRNATAEWDGTARLLAPDVAIAEGPLTIHLSGGAPDLLGYAVDIWRKIDGRWQLVGAHPKLFPPRPA